MAPIATYYRGGGGGGGGYYGGGGGGEQVSDAVRSGGGGGGGSNLPPAGAAASIDTTGQPLIRLVYEDAAGPTVTMNVPPAVSRDASLGGTSGVALGDSDPEISLYAGANVSGAPVVTETLSRAANGTWWYGLALDEGQYTAVVRQSDDAGHSAQSPARTFVIDSTAPAVALDALTPRTNVPPAITGRAGRAANDSATVTVKIEGGSENHTLTATRDASTGVFQVAAPALPEGSYSVTASQTDVAGNTGTAEGEFTIDTTAPSLMLGVSATLTTPPVVTFSGTAGTTPGDLRPVTVNIHHGKTTAGELVQTQTALSDPATGKYSIDASPTPPDGYYTVQASQDDNAGNTTRTAPQTITIGTPPPEPTPGGQSPTPTNPSPTAPVADRTAPVLGSLRLSPKRIARTGARLRFTLSEAANVTIRITKGKRTVATVKKSLKAGANAIKLSRRIGRRTLRPGAYRITVVATDRAGNRSRPRSMRATVR